MKEVTAAVVRVITMTAEETEGAVKGPGTAEATEIVAAKTVVPARVMGTAAVIRAAKMPEEVEDEVAGTVAVAVRATEPPEEMPKAVVRAVEVGAAKAVEAPVVVAVVAKATAEMPAVAAKAVGALELAIIRVPGIVAAPAKSMEAEAALVPKAPGALEAQAIRPATTAAANLGERRLQHPRP
ncbi:hypothetical protein [Microvirga ossetica]|nr:hypothetical protein [Microvirga ossetica]